MVKFTIQILIAAILLISFSSCDNNRVFEEYQSIPEPGWHKDSVFVFEVLITDTLQNHNLLVNVRNSITYSYSNLWLFIEIEEPGGIFAKDTFELSLADPMGKWLGEGFGGLKTRQVVYRRNVYFPRRGTYRIQIKQGMREEILEGINDIGFRVEKIH
jgi:gliding motility-associated lipoprotein GldH